MKKRKMPGGSGRDLFPGHSAGAGKGDAPRYRHDAKWIANYEDIDWHRDPNQTGKKFFKRYGKSAPKIIELVSMPAPAVG